MKYINSQSEGPGGFGHGLLQRWAGCVLGLVLFFSGGASVALAQSGAMTQHQYLQWMANICGNRLSSSATANDYAIWARGKGMNPTGGWQLNAKLSREVVAQTLVQLLNLAPRKGNFDAIRILEREGIFISSSAGYVSIKHLVRLIDDGFGRRFNRGDDDDGASHGGGDDDGHGGGGDDDGGGGGGDDDGGSRDDDDDGGGRDDDDGPPPTPTKPGNGHGHGHGHHKPGHHGKGHGKPGHKWFGRD